MAFDVAETDLARVAAELKRTFGDRPPLGYVVGKTMFRDAVMNELGCSALQAEQVVDTMISRGFLRYEGSVSRAIDDAQPWAVV